MTVEFRYVLGRFWESIATHVAHAIWIDDIGLETLLMISFAVITHKHNSYVLCLTLINSLRCTSNLYLLNTIRSTNFRTLLVMEATMHIIIDKLTTILILV